MIEPIVIISPGNCGSSSLAKILFEMGVYMGNPKRFVRHSRPPGLLYEDVEILDMIGLHRDRSTLEIRDSFYSAWDEIILSRFQLKKPWGFKVGGWEEPPLHRALLAPFHHPTLIRLERDVATRRNRATVMDEAHARIRSLLGEKKVLPMYLSDIVLNVAKEKLIQWFEQSALPGLKMLTY
jgi:hypothetical protein